MHCTQTHSDACKSASKLIFMRPKNRRTELNRCWTSDNTEAVSPPASHRQTTTLKWNLCVPSGGNPKYPETKETFSETGPGHGLCAHTVSLSLVGRDVRNSIPCEATGPDASHWMSPGFDCTQLWQLSSQSSVRVWKTYSMPVSDN